MINLNEIHHGDCLQVLKTLADNSVDLIATDPPYFRVKGEAWDNQWASAAAFLDWIDALCVEWRRVLKPNGSLYVFASPQMSHGVEGVIRKHFNVLSNIRWVKKHGWHQKAKKETLRSYTSPYETVIFAEQGGGGVCEPIRAYLDSERVRANLTMEQVRKMVGCADGSGLPSHWFTRSQWMLPTAEQYAKLQAGFNNQGDYEYLRRDYEDLRRFFEVTAADQFNDVWNFSTVQPYKGKHVCEKPAALMEHIIASSSRPGAVVLDCFMGSNATGKAARKLGRAYIGIELDPHWVEKAEAYRESASQTELALA